MLKKTKTKTNMFLYIFIAILLVIFLPRNVKAYEATTVLEDMSYLESLAENYKTENNLSIDTKLLVSTYIRNSAYDSTWNQYGGTSDPNFDAYVDLNSSNLSYLRNVYSLTMSSGDTIDFKRLLSDLNILINKGSLFGSWVSDIYDLNVVIANQNVSAEDIAKNYYNSFSSSGCLTNIDAFNIYKKYGNKLSDSIKSYYSSINKDERMKQFTTNLGISSISKDSIRTSVLANYKNCSEIMTLLNLKGISESSNEAQIKGAAYAYADYIYNNHPNRAVLNEINLGIEDFSLNLGEEKTLTITTNPQIDTSLLTLTSSSPEVISVIDSNKIKAISEGTSKITCSYAGVSKSVNVNVIGEITSIKFAVERLDIEAGTADKLEPLVTPSTNKNYVFSSSNKDVADIDENGNIFTFKAGKTYITCKSTKNPDIYATCELVITQTIQSITSTLEQINLAKGESCKFGLTITPEKHTDKLIYSSSDESIVKISPQGNITAVNVGTAIVTCMSELHEEIKAECIVNVSKAIEKISFEKTFYSVDMYENPNFKLNVFLTPSTANISSLIFEISDKEIATLNEKTMTLTFLKKGQFYITCRSKEDETVQAKVNFYVMNNEPTKEPEDKITSIPDKDAEVEIDDIIDKGDTTVIEEKKDIFEANIMRIAIIILIIVMVGAIIISIIVEVIKRNKENILEGLGFENDFEEDEGDILDIESNKPTKNTFHNWYRIIYQTETDAEELKEKLETEAKLKKLEYQEIEEEMEKQRIKDLNDTENNKD